MRGGRSRRPAGGEEEQRNKWPASRPNCDQPSIKGKPVNNYTNPYNSALVNSKPMIVS